MSDFEPRADGADARLLARLQDREVVSAMQRAYRGYEDLGAPEPCALRAALAKAGVRSVVTPPLTADLRIATADGHHVWPSARLPEVLDELAEHDQATLHFTVCRLGPDDNCLYRTSNPREDTMLEYAQPWPAFRQQANSRAKAQLDRVAVGDGLVALIEWIGEDDF